MAKNKNNYKKTVTDNSINNNIIEDKIIINPVINLQESTGNKKINIQLNLIDMIKEIEEENLKGL